MAYTYHVRDRLGNLIDGLIEAVSVEDATRLLRADGFEVLKISESEDSFGIFQGRRISRNDIINITTQLSVMVDTGITLPHALNGMAEVEDNPKMRAMLNGLKSSVEAGDSFSTALEKYPKYFDPTYVALVKASEATGTMGEMLEYISDYLSKDVDNRNKVRAALAYPAVMMLVAIGVTIFLLIYILPKFTPLFTRKAMQLPLPTVIMMKVSDALINYWYFLILGFLAIIGGLIYILRTPSGRKTWHYIKINLPIIGPLFRKVAISRSMRTLGAMIGGGVSVLESLKLSADVAGNYFYEQVWLNAIQEVTNGKQICDSLKGNSLIPSTLTQMISSGEESGKIDKVLQKISVFYEREVDNTIQTTSRLIEPLMICVMGVIVGGIAMALMLPIFKLSSHGG